MKRNGKTIKLLAIVLVISTILSSVACSEKTVTPSSASNSAEITEIEITEIEKTEIETTIVETTITEFITKEVYLEEFTVAEEKISELLVGEDQIDEILTCKTIYIPEEHIEDFAEHSQTTLLFGNKADIKPILLKIAVGTGIILTLTILKKVGVDKPVFSVVVAAADGSLKFSKTGAVVGSVFGAFTGAADEIDKSGKIAAIAGFALATVGLIIATVSLVGAVPSAGTSGFGVAEGVHLAWAGVKFATTAIATTQAAQQTIKAFNSTDATEIDWNNINWDKVGVNAAQKAINNGADGYMWGSIYGAIDGATQKYYEKYCTPYTKYNERLKQTPKNNEYGHWTGERGDSEYVYDKNRIIKVGEETYEIEAGTKVNYQNAVPDFEPYKKAQVNISQMTNNRTTNFKQADRALAEYWTKTKHEGHTWTARQVNEYRIANKLTWHEMSNMESMQLVPTKVNAGFGHYGGVGEYNAMIGEKLDKEYD